MLQQACQKFVEWKERYPEAGLDCSRLVSHVFHEVTGMVLPRNSRAMSKEGSAVEKNELKPGDLVFFNTLRRPFSHVGIYIGEDRFVHAPRRLLRLAPAALVLARKDVADGVAPAMLHHALGTGDHRQAVPPRAVLGEGR